MMTWDDLVAHTRASFAVIEVGSEHLVIGWKVGDGMHTQRVDLVTAYGAPWVRIASHSGARDGVSADAVLTHNATLAIGALAVDGSALVLQHLVPLALLGPAHLDLLLTSIAHEAARLRPHGFRR